MAAVQMNVRIDEDVKARGDEVFARAGLTPSQVVRAVWEYAERTGEVPAFVCALETDADVVERQRKIALLEQGAHIWENFFLDHRLSVPKGKEHIDYKTLRDELYDDMLEEAGL